MGFQPFEKGLGIQADAPLVKVDAAIPAVTSRFNKLDETASYHASGQ
jgi:hypothetical protein